MALAKVFEAIIYYVIASTIIFFQHNMQLISHDNFKAKTHVMILLFSIPVSYLFYFSWSSFVNEYKSVWTARFIFFGLSYFVFPVLAYIFTKESPFTIKTITCTILSIIIIWIQCKY